MGLGERSFGDGERIGSFERGEMRFGMRRNRISGLGLKCLKLMIGEGSFLLG